MQEGMLSPLRESQVLEHAGVFKDLNACKFTLCIKHEAGVFVLDSERSSPFLVTDVHGHCTTTPPPRLTMHPQ